MRKSFLAILAIIACIAVHAQKIRGGSLFFRVGYSYSPQIDKVISNMEATEMSLLTNHFVLIGGEGYYRTGSKIISLDYLVGAHVCNPSSSEHVEPFSAAGHVKFGWIVKDRKNYWIYPSIGGGTALASLSTYNKVNGASPVKYINNTLPSPSFDLGINGDFLIHPKEDNELCGGLMIGLRLGYRASFKSSN